MINNVESNNGALMNGAKWNSEQVHSNSEPKTGETRINWRRLGGVLAFATTISSVGIVAEAMQRDQLRVVVYDDDFTKGVGIIVGENLDHGVAFGMGRSAINIQRGGQPVQQENTWKPVFVVR